MSSISCSKCLSLLIRLVMATSAVCLLGAATLRAQQSGSSSSEPRHGAYLGCFSFDELEIDRTKVAKFDRNTIDRCMPYCGGQKHTLHIVSPSYQCWCSSLIPDAAAQLADTSSSCGSAGGNGVAVFYHHKDAAVQGCRLAPVALEPSSFTVHYNKHHLSFNSANPAGEPEMVLQQTGPDGIRLVVNDGFFKHGQYQVAAKPSGASGVVTAFYVRDNDAYTLSNKNSAFSEIDIEMMNGNPAVPASIWLNSFYKGMSQGETLVKPADYQALLGLPSSVTTADTFFVLGFSWQKDGVIWSINGVPLLRRYYDQLVSWTEMGGKSYSKRYRPPDAASHVTFSIWADGNQTRSFGGKLNTAESPYFSRFRSLRRILCDQPMPSDPVAAAAAFGPAWLTSSSNEGAAAEGAAGAGPGGSRGGGTQGGSAAPALSVLASAKTLTTSVAGAEQGQHCLELERMPQAGGGVARLGVYPCSSRSPVWVYDPATQSLSLNKAGNGCLTALEGQPIVTVCQQYAAEAMNRNQQWELADGGRLRSKAGLCVGIIGELPLKPLLSSVQCSSAQELVWRPGVTDVLNYLKPAKVLVTYNPDFGYCLGSDAAAVHTAAVAPCTLSAAAFYYEPFSKQIIRKDSKLCLETPATGAGSVTISPCRLVGATNQEWSFVNGRNLRSRSGVCIGVEQATAQLVAVDCDSSEEARWVFGAGDVLAGLNPGKALTTANSPPGGTIFAVDIVLQATQADGLTTPYLGLQPGIASSLKFKFNTTTGQIRSVGRREGLCLTARSDLKAVQLARCQGKAGQLHAAQSWSWYAGQLRAAGGGAAEGQCLVKGEVVAASGDAAGGGGGGGGSAGASLLTLGSCLHVADDDKITWSFGGVAPP